MFYRNVTLFSIPQSVSIALRSMIEDLSSPEGDGLQLALQEHALKPVGPMELMSTGMLSPFGHDQAALYMRGSAQGVDTIVLAVGTDSKVLPAGAVNRAWAEKIRAFEKANDRQPGGRMRRQLKDEVVQEMLPKAFIQSARTDMYIDLARDLVVVDTASRKQAEAVVSQIRAVLGSFPALPINAETAPRAVLTAWVAGEAMPDALILGNECELRGPTDSGAVVKIHNMELASEEIQNHLEAGKQVTRLAVVEDEHLQGLLAEDLVLRKLKLLDAVLEKQDEGEGEGSLNAHLTANHILFAGVFGAFLDRYRKIFALSKAD